MNAEDDDRPPPPLAGPARRRSSTGRRRPGNPTEDESGRRPTGRRPIRRIDATLSGATGADAIGPASQPTTVDLTDEPLYRPRTPDRSGPTMATPPIRTSASQRSAARSVDVVDHDHRFDDGLDDHDPFYAQPGQRRSGQERERFRERGPGPFDGVGRSPVPLLVAVAIVVLGAAIYGGLLTTDDEDGSSEAPTSLVTDDQPPDETLGEEGGSQQPVSPSALPPADEPGLVGLELPLIDPYTGTGSTGTVQLYLNAVSGQVCHRFDAPAMAGNYRAYLHQAPYPLEGPVVVDLGQVANSIPVCVMSNPIDLARALRDGEEFYVAAHGEEKTFILRGQMSTAVVAFDNRDPDLIADQEALVARTTSTIGDGSADDLFGAPDEGAFIVVDIGRVSFEGEVPDEATADRLRAAFIPLLGRGLEVTDNLVIQPTAPPPSGRVVVAGALLFDTGQDRITGDPEVLATVVDLMTVNPGWTMTITGHTDNVGEWLVNIELSLRRANTVRNRLVDLGVPAERLRVQGAGPEEPIGDNQTDEGRARNRRIEISIDS